MKNLKITVLMSVYNGEKYLREAIDSILNQTFKDFEFLIINDGSTDRTAEILQSYQNPRIKIINNEKNIGLTRSLNKGLRLAKGEYIARMDVDDIAAPERLQEQVGMLEREASLGLVGTWYSVIDDEGNMLCEVKDDGNSVVLRWKLLFSNIFVHSSVMVRKKACEDVGGYNPKFEVAQDYALWSHIAKKWQIGLVPKILCHWRKRIRDSITVEKKEIQETVARQISFRNVSELTHGRLSRKQCIDFCNLIKDYRLADKVSRLGDVLHHMKIVRKCFEDMTNDRSVRRQINNQATAVLCYRVFRSTTFFQRIFVCAYALWFGGWTAAQRTFLTFAGMFLPDIVKNGGKRFLKLLRWDKLVSL